MDSDELGRLIDRHAAALELYARQWCDTPEDVVQEAFLKLAGQGGLPDKPAAWLFRGVRKGAINASTAPRARRRPESGAAEGRTWFPAERHAPHPDALDPESATAELQALPLEQREVIVGHLWGGLTFEQIAQITGISSSTAHRQYCAGLSTLRERLGVSCHRTRTIP